MTTGASAPPPSVFVLDPERAVTGTAGDGNGRRGDLARHTARTVVSTARTVLRILWVSPRSTSSSVPGLKVLPPAAVGVPLDDAVVFLGHGRPDDLLLPLVLPPTFQ